MSPATQAGASATQAGASATQAGASATQAGASATQAGASATQAGASATQAGASTTQRQAALARLADETFDVLIVGGGATGAAMARDAALRGLTVALCERGDFASETSSHSSKLIHGGLRYLQYGDFALVFEALAERRALQRTAPHLCRPIEFLFPAYQNESPRLATLAAGVALYDALSLWRPPARSRRMAPTELYETAPALRTAGLVGAMSYVDCQTDDARLVLENILDAEAAGAAAVSYVEVERPAPRTGHLTVVRARDRATGASIAIRCLAVVNATGPFSDAFARGRPALRPTMGVHLAIDGRRLPTGGRAFVLRAPESGRIVFTLPAGPRTLIGTTDTDWVAPDGTARAPRAGDRIEARREDVDYLLRVANHAFPSAALAPDDVISTYAGLRPLIAGGADSPASTSREHAIWVDAGAVLTVAGGKLTTMRRMAEDAVDALVELLRARGLDRSLDRCTTARRPLPGGRPAPPAAQEVAPEIREHLATTYGSRAAAVIALGHTVPGAWERLDAELPCRWAEVVFAVRHDRALTVEDVLRRRLPVFRLARDQGLALSDKIANVLADELGLDGEFLRETTQAYRERVAASRAWQATGPVPSPAQRSTHDWIPQ